MIIDNNILKNLFHNIYFINGTAYAGKSTMVKLLADKYDGICCGENYHMELLSVADPEHQPNLCYFDTMRGWQEFISRTPEEYDAWLTEEQAEKPLSWKSYCFCGFANRGRRYLWIRTSHWTYCKKYPITIMSLLCSVLSPCLETGSSPDRMRKNSLTIRRFWKPQILRRRGVITGSVWKLQTVHSITEHLWKAASILICAQKIVL